jgi:hypothetical protein
VRRSPAQGHREVKRSPRWLLDPWRARSGHQARRSGHRPPATGRRARRSGHWRPTVNLESSSKQQNASRHGKVEAMSRRIAAGQPPYAQARITGPGFFRLKKPKYNWIIWATTRAMAQVARGPNPPLLLMFINCSHPTFLRCSTELLANPRGGYDN